MVAAGIVVADKGHDSLGKAHGYLQGNHVDFLGNAHGSHCLGAVGGCKIVQYGHTCHIQKILDCRRYAHGAHSQHNVLLKRKLLWIDTDKGCFPSDPEQHKKIDTGNAVGKKRGKAGSRRSHIKPPRQNKDRIQNDIQQTAAHGSDAGMKG